MGFISGFLYFAPFFVTAAVIYALWRNQREASSSPLIDKTNFGPRIGAVVEVVLHPDHAADWWRPATKQETALIESDEYPYPWASATLQDSFYMVRVFPTLGMDSSEVHGIRLDDGESS